MSKRAIWRALQDHHAAMHGLNLKKLFAVIRRAASG
jgi:hypothetical protein